MIQVTDLNPGKTFNDGGNIYVALDVLPGFKSVTWIIFNTPHSFRIIFYQIFLIYSI